jgi:hypothetical protein
MPTTLLPPRQRRYKSGQKVLVSGQYTNTDGDQVTCVKGEIFPPTPRPRMTWKLSDSSRGKHGPSA